MGRSGKVQSGGSKKELRSFRRREKSGVTARKKDATERNKLNALRRHLRKHPNDPSAKKAYKALGGK